jgi:DNA-binding Xre family transcriptional regulator
MSKWQFDQPKFWALIARAMKTRKLGYREAALQIGITPTMLWRLGGRRPTVKTLLLVCAWLRVKPTLFIVREPR